MSRKKPLRGTLAACQPPSRNGDETITEYQNLPDAATVAQRLGGRKAGTNDWRLPHLCGGETAIGDNPGLSIGDGDDGLIVKCWHDCATADAYAAVCAAAGIDSEPNGWNVQSGIAALGILSGSCPACGSTAFRAWRPDWATEPDDYAPYLLMNCRDCTADYSTLHRAACALVQRTTGKPLLQRAPYTLADGQRRYRFRRDPGGDDRKGSWDAAGKGRKTTKRKPLCWQVGQPDYPAVIAEGDKAGAALASAGLPNPIYTVGDTAGLKSADYSELTGQSVIIWADRDSVKVNQRTGRIMGRPGPKAAGKAGDELAGLGNAVRYVQIEDLDDGKDAADVSPVDMRVRLADAVETRPAVDEPEPPGGESKPPGGYSWYPEEDDYLPPWAMTPDADIMRTIRRYSAELMVVMPDDGSPSYLRAVSTGGVWARCDDEIDRLITATAIEWAKDALDAPASAGTDPRLSGAVAAYAKRMQSQDGRNRAQASVGPVYREWLDRGTVPGDLTACYLSKMDIEGRYLGAQNGVVDLNTGQLITGKAASRKLVTRRVPDDYDPQASHPVVDGLLNHLGEEERGYLLAALGFALRGNPARRFYVLAGERNGGKSTVLAAVSACLGDVRAGGYGLALAGDALVSDRTQHSSGHQSAYFGIQDARIAVISEMPDGRSRFNNGLFRTMTGGDPMNVRDVREKAGPMRPARGTVFIALNPGDVERLDLTDAALKDRARILPYPPLPTDQRNPAVLQAVRENPAVRQAMLAVLVRAASAFAGDPYPPKDIPSVWEAVEERLAASIGEVGQWLLENVKVTGRGDHRLTTDALIASLAAEYSPDERERYAGRSRREVLALAREVVPGFPAAKVIDKRRCYPGVRLATAEELQAHFEQLDEDWGPDRCIRCGSDNDGNPLVDVKWCMKCKLDMDESRRVAMGRTGSVSPAIERIAGDGVAVLDADDVDPERAAEAQKVIAEYLRQRAGLDVLTENLGRAAQAVADGATMGSETPDQLVNRTFPQYFEVLKGFVAESVDGQQEAAGDGDDAE